MKVFNLIINGKEYITQKYKFFISVEEILKNPKLALLLRIRELSIIQKILFRINYLISFFKKNSKLNYFKKYNNGFKYKMDIPTSCYYAKYSYSDNNENLLAIEAAKNASKVFNKKTNDERLMIAIKLVRDVIEEKEELREILIAEGHAYKLAEFELNHLFNNILTEKHLEFLSGNIKTRYYSKNDILEYYPYGVFGIITPYNGPLIAAALTIISGIISGNTMIIKPSSDFPLSTFKLVKIFNNLLSKLEVPPGILNIVVGDSKKIVNEWIRSRDVDGIIFFGASRHGIEIAKKCDENNKKIILELSGSDAVLVWKDADLMSACDDIITSRFLASGQFCIAIKRAFIHDDIYNDFEKIILNKLSLLKIGLPSNKNVNQVAIGDIEMLEKLKLILKDAINKGAKAIAGNNFLDYNCKKNNYGLFLEPTILTDINMNMNVMKEEVFGPILPLIKVKSIDESIKLINNSNYGLRASIWCKNDDLINVFIKNIQAGSIIINSSHYYMGEFSSHLGGLKASGIIGAKYFSEEMCFKKYIHSNKNLS